MKAGYKKFADVWHIAVMCFAIIMLAFAFTDSFDKLAGRFVGVKYSAHELVNDAFRQNSPYVTLPRALSAAARLELKSSFGHHPIGPVMFLWLIIQPLYRTLAITLKGSKIPKSIHRIMGVFTVVVFGLLAGIFIFE